MTFETKSSCCRVARQSVPRYRTVARLGFKRCATAVLKSNLIRSIAFGTAVARRLKQALPLALQFALTSSQVKRTPKMPLMNLLCES